MTAHYSETENTMNTFSLNVSFRSLGELPNMWRGAYTLSLPFGGGISLDKWSVYAPYQGLSKMICPNFSERLDKLKGKGKITSAWLGLVGLPGEPANLSLTRYDWRDTGQRKFAQMGGHWFYTTKVPDPWRLPELFSVDEVLFKLGAYEPSIITRTRTHTRGRYHGPSYEFNNWRNIK